MGHGVARAGLEKHATADTMTSHKAVSSTQDVDGADKMELAITICNQSRRTIRIAKADEQHEKRILKRSQRDKATCVFATLMARALANVMTTIFKAIAATTLLSYQRTSHYNRVGAVP